MTLEPTVTIERPMPTSPKIEVAPPAGEFVVSQIAANRPNPLSMGVAPSKPGGRHVMPAATPFSRSLSVHPTPVSAYPKKALAAGGIRMLSEKTKLEAGLVFEENGGAFVLKAIVAGTNERTTLWNGMEIAKDTFSDLLGRLTKFGFAEFSTLGAAGSGNFDRMTFRTAFGVKGAEWLTLVKVKSATGGDAIVAFLTAGSIQVHLPAFHSAGMPAARAA
jgi:hypothetical protein